MKKLITCLSAVLLMLGVTTALATASCPRSSNTTATNMAKKAPSFMFVLSAKSAALKKNNNGVYFLTMNKSDMSKIIMFSDRPERIVKDITAKVLASDWTKGKSSFSKEPPNAVLSGSNMNPTIVTLEALKMNNSFIRFRISPVAESTLEAVNLVDPVVVVDAKPPVDGCPQPPPCNCSAGSTCSCFDFWFIRAHWCVANDA